MIPSYLKIGNGKSGYTPQLTNIWELYINPTDLSRLTVIDQKDTLVDAYNRYLDLISSHTLDDMSSNSNQNGGLVTQIKNKSISDILSLLVNNVTVPQITMEDSTTQIPIIQLKTQSGRYTYSQVTLKFNEYIYLPATTFFMLWVYKCIFDPKSGKYGLVQNYKLPKMTVKLSSNTDQTQSIMQWNLYGVYPQQLDNGQLNYTQTENLNSNVTLNIDYMEMERR